MKHHLISFFLAGMMIFSLLHFSSDDPVAIEENDLNIVLMGDMVFDGTIGDRIRSQGIDYPFKPISSLIEDADLTIANLETPISDRGVEETGKYCTFRSEKGTVRTLTNIGMDAVSLANNHCLDYGYDALNDTMNILDDNSLEYAGIWYNDQIENASIPRPVILRHHDLKIGFLSYTEDVRDHWKATDHRAGPIPIDPGIMEDDIRHSKDKVDILIVSIHWRKWPQYTTGPEEADRILCRKAVDWGADLIMGHGPHTVHEVEDYRGGLILYSLGNVAMINGHENASFSYIASINFKDGRLDSLELIPIQLGTYRYVPMGTPLIRTDETGFNVTYDDVWNMYDEDIYDLIGKEEGLREWRILLEDSPWYMKSLLVIALLSVLILIFTILYVSIKRRKH